MPDRQQNDQNDFLVERIKVRPINRKKLIRRTILTAAMAVIFGLIACVTFLVLEPVINRWLYPEEKPPMVSFPEDRMEMLPEEMLAENLPAESPSPPPAEESAPVELEDEQIQEILASVVLDRENYVELFTAMSGYVNELKKYLVTVTAVTSNVDWFNNVQESRNQISGLIIANNGKELLVLADASSLRRAEKLLFTFSNGVQVPARIKQQDSITNLAMLSVELTELPEVMQQEEIPIASLGSSYRNLIGVPVVAMGRPMGTMDSIGYGMITSADIQLSVSDRNYNLLLTDISGSQNAGGFLFDLQGEVVGIIIGNKTGSDMKNMINAYGISEVKRIIEKMSGENAVAYMGIRGLDVPGEVNQELGVPTGAFVKELDTDSPAMPAGLQPGDVIIGINDRSVSSFTEYTNILLQLSPGDTVELTVMRKAQEEYKEMKFSIELGEVK